LCILSKQYVSSKIKETTETTKKGLEKIITKHQQTQFDRTKMTEDMKKLEEENSKLKEGLLDVQCSLVCGLFPKR
jgi:predicted nuclease with TOPRIM domain